MKKLKEGDNQHTDILKRIVRNNKNNNIIMSLHLNDIKSSTE